MGSKQSRSCLKVPFFNGWCNDHPISGDVGAEAAEGDHLAGDIEDSSPDFDRQHRLKLNEGQPGNDALGARLGQNALHVFGAGLLMVKLCERAGVEKVSRHSAFFSRGDYGVCERTRN